VVVHDLQTLEDALKRASRLVLDQAKERRIGSVTYGRRAGDAFSAAIAALVEGTVIPNAALLGAGKTAYTDVLIKSPGTDVTAIIELDRGEPGPR
jgi:hypothetical protein